MTTVLTNGFFVGLIYALLGMGLVITYRGARVVNFAYGETGMIAVFVFVDLWMKDGRSLVLALAVSILLAAAIGALTERLVARPLRKEPQIVPMVATIAVGSLLLVYAARRWGTAPQYMQPLVTGAGWQIGDVHVQASQILILVVSVLLFVALSVLYRFTDFGLRMRATAVDRDAAAQLGINTDRTAMATWALAGALAGASAIMIGPLVTFDVTLMTGLLVRGIAAALVGGLTSLAGAATAGIALGLAEAVIAYKSPVEGATEAVLAVFVIALVLVRPGGLVRTSY